MALVTRGQTAVNMLDYNAEPQEHSFYETVLSAGNFAAQMTLRDNYMTALAGISSAAVSFYRTGNYARYEPQVPAASEQSAREENWLVGLVDGVTGERSTIRIPSPIVTGLLLSHSDRADLGAGAIAAYVTALEAVALSKAGNAVAVQGIVRVGKSDRSPKSPFG